MMTTVFNILLGVIPSTATRRHRNSNEQAGDNRTHQQATQRLRPEQQTDQHRHQLVKAGDVVQRGQIIAHTGSTGLAFGDHLHFGILVGGVEVTPLEWLDPKWIKDNITGRIDASMTQQ